MTAGAGAPFRRALRRARELVGDHVPLLPLVLALTPEGFSRAIDERTELVVEGYPRSGTTFAAAAFTVAQGRDVAVSSHVHVPAQVKLAVRRGVPTLVVVRRPLDAAASLIVAAPHVRPVAALREYGHHHREILPLHPGYVVATFEQVTTAMGDVTERINARFGTSFVAFDGSDAAVAAALALVDERHAAVYGDRADHVLPRPSPERAEPLERARRALLAPRLRHLLDGAEAAYASMASLATQ